MRRRYALLLVALGACRGEAVGVEDAGSSVADSSETGIACSPPPGVTGSCPDGMALVLGGCFTRVDGRRAVIAAFCFDTREVTLGAYRDCATAGMCTPPATTITKFGDATDAQVAVESKLCNVNATPSRADHPINCVDHDQAIAFCKYRGAQRLPSAEEWEWAARGRERASIYPWGDEAPSDQPCWSGVVRRGSTCVAGSSSKDETPDGIRDLAGNLFEWTSTPSTATTSWFLMLGGSFGTNDPKVMAVGHWYDGGPDFRFNTGGFRCAK